MGPREVEGKKTGLEISLVKVFVEINFAKEVIGDDIDVGELCDMGREEDSFSLSGGGEKDFFSDAGHI